MRSYGHSLTKIQPCKDSNLESSTLETDGGMSPVGAYKRVEALQVFHVFKTILIASLKRDEMLTWLIFHLFGNLSDNNWRQFYIVCHLSILRYFQFNEVSQGWRCLRIRMPTDQVPCKTIGISNLHCALHMHMPTNARSAITFEIGVIP